jgi:hypothetical protein
MQKNHNFSINWENVYKRSLRGYLNMNVQEILNYYAEEVDPNVKGWLYPIDIMIISALLKEGQRFSGDIVELGTAFGKSSILLSICRNDNENLWLYDLYAAEDLSLEVVKENLKTYGNDNLVNHKVIDLMKIKPEEITGDFLRLLHIDACHLHKAVLNDLNNFEDRLLTSGIIVVDDYNDPEYPGINTAVTELCLKSRNNWVVFAIGQNKCYICRKEYLKYYSTFLATFINQNFSTLNMNVSEFIDGYVLQVASRSNMSIDDIIQLLKGEKELKYT